MKSFSLLEVARSVQKTLSGRYGSAFWVRAEMNKLNHYKHSGHCYPELLEKENGKVIAQMNGILWKTDFMNANNKFLSTLKEPLHDGIKILFLAKLVYDPAHGLALQILDIDPSFTMGDLQREKQQSLEKLRLEGLYDRNKRLALAVLPKRLAIISIETSKGYADFLNVLEHNRYGYRFSHFLFPSVLQGERAVDGIIGQLANIKKVLKHFDVVAIIRGGGGDVGLSCYNNYSLAREIASFPIPVITGIGHATNETVAEMISHLNAITPTKLADYLLQRVHDFAVPVEEYRQFIVNSAVKMLSAENRQLSHETKLFRSVATGAIQNGRNAVSTLKIKLESVSRSRIHRDSEILSNDILRMASASNNQIRSQKNAAEMAVPKLMTACRNLLSTQGIQLQGTSVHLQALKPENILKRGFSITIADGKPVRNASDVRQGQTITTILYEGSLESEVKTIKLNNE